MSRNVGTPVVTDKPRSVQREDERLRFSDRVSDRGTGVVSEKKSDWKSTAYSSAKVVIDVVKESSEVFPPLKAAASGLAAVLKHCDVRSISPIPSAMLITTSASNDQ